MRSLHLTLAAAAVALPLPSSGQSCACAPSSYDFALNFAGTCDDGVGLDPGSPGLEGSVCFYTRGGSPEDLEDGDVQFGAPSRLRRLGSPPGVVEDARRSEWTRALKEVDLAAQREHAEGVAAARRRRTQEGGGQWRQDDVAPTVVTSVTFLEADSTPSLNIINQDSTYFEGEYADGEVLSYDSVSAELDPSVPLSDQIDKLPGGVMLVLFGVNSASEVVQNTVAWGYNLNDCDDEPLSDGDGVGWVSLSSYSPPMPEFCPAVTASPTAGPTNAPTDPPTTAAPPMSMSMPDPCDAKSGKGSKSGIFAKSSKTAKSLDEEMGDAKAAKVYPEGEGASCKSAKVHVEPVAKSAKVMAKSAKSTKSTKAAGEATVEAKSAKSEEASTPFAKSAKSEEMSTPLAKSSKSGGLDAKAGSSSKAAKVHATASAKAAKAAGPDASAKSVKAKSAKSASGTMSAPHGKAEKAKSHKGDAKAVKASDDGASAKSAKTKSAKADSAGMMSVGKSEKAKGAKAAGGKSAKAEPAALDAKATKMSDHSKSAKAADPVSASQGYHEVVAHPGE